MTKSKNELFTIIGKQTVIIDNYQHLLEDIEMGFLTEERVIERIKEANKLAAELSSY